jgi:hypothetical protein
MRFVDWPHYIGKDPAHYEARGPTIGLKFIVRPQVSDQSNRLIQLAADIPHKSLDLCCNLSVRDHRQATSSVS